MLQLLPNIKHTNEHMKITQTLYTNNQTVTRTHVHTWMLPLFSKPYTYCIIQHTSIKPLFIRMKDSQNPGK